MLNNCLRSCIELHNPCSWHVEILVIDNGDSENSKKITETISSLSPFAIYLITEHVKGIPYARNRALDECNKKGNDWIAFIDDDETVDEHWLTVMQQASLKIDADVFHGQTDSVINDSRKPFWPIKPKKRHRNTFQPLQTAGTDNVMFRSHLVSAPGLNLRFDEDMRFSGGSDREFFYRANDLGAKIVWVPEAKTYELVPITRQTFSYRIRRAYSVAANECYISKKRYGLRRTITLQGLKAAGRFIAGLMWLPFSPLAFLLPHRSLRLQTIESAKKLSAAGGTFRGLLARPPARYSDIQGQ